MRKCFKDFNEPILHEYPFDCGKIIADEEINLSTLTAIKLYIADY